MLTWQVAQLGSTGVAEDVLWLDVDEATYLSWHAPPVTPRDRLCRLIDFAVRGNARVVVVDVDLTYPSPPGSFPALQGCSPGDHPARAGPAAADQELRDYLRRYAIACARGARRRCATIVLARSLHTSAASRGPRGDPVQTPRASFLDDAAFARGGVVLWSSTRFDYDEDAMIRRWRLWEPLCDPRSVLPSTELVAATVFAGRASSQLDRALRELRPACVPASSPMPLAAGSTTERAVDVDIGYPLRLTTDELERRFFYRIAWDAERDRPSMAAFVPAALVTDATADRQFDPAVARGRIVVIGGSYLDNPDVQRTPLGMMPGTLILINAIQALVSNDHVREVPLLLRLTIELALILVLSAAFLYLPPLYAMSISTVLVVVSALTVGYAFLNAGYWIDPVLPLIGIQVHELVALGERRFHPEGASA